MNHPDDATRVRRQVWLMLGAAQGVMFSFPVFLVPLLEEFRWSRGVAAGAFSLSAVVQGALSPVIGALVDRMGPRRVILGGMIVLALTCMLGSRITSLWQLYLVTGVLTATALCAVGFVPSGALIAQWFADRQASMMGIAFSGMGVGVLTVGPLSQALISSHGWRGAYLALGLGLLVLLVPAVWFGVREAPHAPPRTRAPRSASKKVCPPSTRADLSTRSAPGVTP